MELQKCSFDQPWALQRPLCGFSPTGLCKRPPPCGHGLTEVTDVGSLRDGVEHGSLELWVHGVVGDKQRMTKQEEAPWPTRARKACNRNDARLPGHEGRRGLWGTVTCGCRQGQIQENI